MFRIALALTTALLVAACTQSSVGTTSSQPLSPVMPGIADSRTGPSIAFFGPPTGFEWPEYITNGPDGNLWFTEFYDDQITRITPTGVYTRFPLPDNNDVEALVTGPDSNIWFTEPGANQIGRMTTKGFVTAFPIHNPNPSPRGICVGPDGNLWFTEYYSTYIGRITTAGVITQFQLPAGASSPWEIIAGVDGILYVTDSTSDDIARFNPKTLKFMTSIKLPLYDNPWGLAIGPDKHVWFTGRHSAKLGVIVSGKVKEFQIPTQGAYPDDLAVGPDGIFYITDSLRNSISRFNTATGTFLPRLILNTADIPTSVVAGPDGNMWFTSPSYTQANNLIGRINLL